MRPHARRIHNASFNT